MKKSTIDSNIKTEEKIGNTLYSVTGQFADKGVTVSDKIKRLLDRENEKKSQ